MIIADLHIHTTASDGTDLPSSIASLAQKSGIDCFAITDHDTVSGLESARQSAMLTGIDMLYGVEASTGPTGKDHILCYLPVERLSDYKVYFSMLKEKRISRALEMIEKLKALGIKLDTEKILSAADSIGRPVIARALLEKGYVTSVQEAFEKYLGDHMPAYVPITAPDTASAVASLRDMGGFPVLAHPVHWKMSVPEIKDLIQHLKAKGLLGIEAYHPDQKNTFKQWRELADEAELVVTGGSDYHGKSKKDITLGCVSASWKDAQASIDHIRNELYR